MQGVKYSYVFMLCISCVLLVLNSRQQHMCVRLCHLVSVSHIKPNQGYSETYQKTTSLEETPSFFLTLQFLLIVGNSYCIFLQKKSTMFGAISWLVMCIVLHLLHWTFSEFSTFTTSSIFGNFLFPPFNFIASELVINIGQKKLYFVKYYLRISCI